MKKYAFISLLAAGVLLTGCGGDTVTSSEQVTSAASETVSTAVTEVTPPPTIDGEIDRFTVEKYPCTTNNLRIDGKDPWLYDFRYAGACGYGRDGTYRDGEMYYGLRADISSRTLTYRFYDYIDSGVKVKSAQLINDNSTRDIIVKEKAIDLDTSKLEDGLYYIRAELSDGSTAELAFYTGAGTTMLCSTSTDETGIKDHSDRRKKMYDLIDLFEVTPGNSYETMRLTYPCYPYDESCRCDTDLWIALSSELTEPDWSDGRKLLTMYEWLTDNLAYDTYMADVLDERREYYYDDLSGTYHMYSTHVGVCWDFANVLITMCRAQKIPAISIENDGATHMWVAVYIDGEWTELDPTPDVRNTVDGEDLTVITPGDFSERYRGFYTLNPSFYYASEMLTINRMLWTAEKDSGGYCLRRPKLEYTTNSDGKIVMIL